MDTIVTRIAPSPTGTLHIGTARAALFNFLFARQHGGTFIVRIEDTDKERSSKAYEADILEGLAWLELTHDILYRQSEKVERHKEVIQALLEKNAAYVSKEASKNEPGREVEVVRLRNPGKDVVFTDLIRGEVSFNTAELGDFVIARSVEEPLYHLAVVVDDAESNVTHVIRGEDHISNTPRQILIMEALGIKRPEYAHIPLILAPDRSKLSKRKGSTAIREYRERGYLPEALINYMAFLGWNPGNEREIYTLDELIQAFSIENIQKSGAVFDIEKLNWFNAQHIKRASMGGLFENIEKRLPKRIRELPQFSRERLKRALPALLERVQFLEEINEEAEAGNIDFYFSEPQYEKGKLIPKDSDGEMTKTHLIKTGAFLKKIDAREFTAEEVKNAVWDYATEWGRGAVLWPMRYALSGKEKSPDPFTLAEIFGKEETLKRIAHASSQL